MTITLKRSACFGSCPDYKVTIYGDGRVQFTTDTAPVDEVAALHRKFSSSEGVLLPGTHEDRVAREAVAALVKQFQKADFWRLKDEYRLAVTDGSTQIVTIVDGTQRKSVIDYFGTEAGMPLAVRGLEDAIDQTAGTNRWVSGSPALVSWLGRTGFKFHSANAAELAVAGEEGHASEATVIALIDRGAPLDEPVSDDGYLLEPQAGPEPAGTLLIAAALRRAHAQVFKRLVAGGWLDRWGRAKAADVFALYAAGCSPVLVDAVAAAGIDIDSPAAFHAQLGPHAAQGKTALAALGDPYACENNEVARIHTAERLLARGADPNHRDSLGWTPLYGVEDLGLLNFLLKNGADATAKSNDGKSMVFGSSTDAIVLRLLEAGASPAGRYDLDGKTLAQKAAVSNMPKVAQWLSAHPEAFRR